MKRSVKEMQKKAPPKEEPDFRKISPDEESILIAVEKGPAGLKQFGMTIEGIRLKVIVKLYTEMIGQTLRQNRNIEQMAPTIAKAAITAADELIRVLTTTDHPA